MARRKQARARSRSPVAGREVQRAEAVADTDKDSAVAESGEDCQRLPAAVQRRSVVADLAVQAAQVVQCVGLAGLLAGRLEEVVRAFGLPYRLGQVSLAGADD